MKTQYALMEGEVVPKEASGEKEIWLIEEVVLGGEYVCVVVKSLQSKNVVGIAGEPLKGLKRGEAGMGEFFGVLLNKMKPPSVVYSKPSGIGANGNGELVQKKWGRIIRRE